jgi:hypothetical protein
MVQTKSIWNPDQARRFHGNDIKSNPDQPGHPIPAPMGSSQITLGCPNQSLTLASSDRSQGAPKPAANSPANLHKHQTVAIRHNQI